MSCIGFSVVRARVWDLRDSLNGILFGVMDGGIRIYRKSDGIPRRAVCRTL